jgi:hypothetical protein
LILSLREGENMLLISRAVEITPQAGGTCSDERVETRSKHIRLRIVGEIHINGLDGY